MLGLIEYTPLIKAAHFMVDTVTVTVTYIPISGNSHFWECRKPFRHPSLPVPHSFTLPKDIFMST